jgi:hypothetical protein
LPKESAALKRSVAWQLLLALGQLHLAVRMPSYDVQALPLLRFLILGRVRVDRDLFGARRHGGVLTYSN